jgi:hypothetical protein
MDPRLPSERKAVPIVKAKALHSFSRLCATRHPLAEFRALRRPVTKTGRLVYFTAVRAVEEDEPPPAARRLRAVSVAFAFSEAASLLLPFELVDDLFVLAVLTVLADRAVLAVCRDSTMRRSSSSSRSAASRFTRSPRKESSSRSSLFIATAVNPLDDAREKEEYTDEPPAERKVLLPERSVSRERPVKLRRCPRPLDAERTVSGRLTLGVTPLGGSPERPGNRGTELFRRGGAELPSFCRRLAAPLHVMSSPAPPFSARYVRGLFKGCV